MEHPETAALSNIRELEEYQRQLVAMLTYVDSEVKRQLQTELVLVEAEICRLWSVLNSGGEGPGDLS